MTILLFLLIINLNDLDKYGSIRSKTLTVKSEYTGQVYQLNILLPENFDENKTYSIIYLTDAFLHYSTVSKIIRDSDELKQRIILVGIFYKHYPFTIANAETIAKLRMQDLTHPLDENNKGEGGGALKFYRCLTKEIIPTVEKKYKSLTENRTLLGHSLGGYFSLFQLFHKPNKTIFSNIAALSPSIYWGDLYLLQMLKQSSMISAPVYLYTGIGEQEQIENNVLFDVFIKELQMNRSSNLYYTYQRYEGAHIHSAVKGFKKALTYFFKERIK